MDTLELTNSSNCREVYLSSANSTIFRLIYSSFFTTSFGTNLVLGLPANSYILWMSMKEMIQGQSTKIFSFNLALVEILFCSGLFFAVAEYFFDCIDCYIMLIFLGQLLLVGRPLFLTCICVERYLGVLHPVTFLKLKPIKYRIALCSIGWIFIISSCATGTMSNIKYYNLLLPQLLFFFFVKLYSCLMVLKALKRPGPGDNLKKRNGVHQDKIKAFRIILIVLVFSTLSYSPMFASLVIYYVVDTERFLLSWSISLLLGILLGLVYPFLYIKRVGNLLANF